MRLGHGHIAESPLKFATHESVSSKVDGGRGDVCGSAGAKADRGDVLNEALAKLVPVHDVHSNGVLMGNCPGRDLENNTGVKFGKENASSSTREVTSPVWDARQLGQHNDGENVGNGFTFKAPKNEYLLTPSEIEGKFNPTDLIDFSSPLQSKATFFKTPEQSYESLEVGSEPSFEEMPSDLGQACQQQGDSRKSKASEGESIWGGAKIREIGERLQPKAAHGNGKQALGVGEKMEAEVQSVELGENLDDVMKGREGVKGIEVQEEKQRVQLDQNQKVQEGEGAHINQEVK